MKIIALASTAAALVVAPSAALAGPYVETKSEAKGTDSDYSGQSHQVRIGHDWKLGTTKPYIEVGAGSGAKDGEEWEGAQGWEMSREDGVPTNVMPKEKDAED